MYIPRDHQAVLKIQHLVECHFRTKREQRFYAEAIGLPPHILVKLLKAYLGKTLHGLIQDRIHKEAERLLILTTLSIKEIAGQLGVSDPPYFTRCFKKRTGLSPVQYRQNHQILPDLKLSDGNAAI